MGMMRCKLLIALSLALCSVIYGYPTMLAPVVSSNTSNHACTKDSDCPGNYCMDGPDKTPPYSCHDDPTPTPPTPPPPAPTDAPNCTQAGQDDLCKIACESTCRSFQPGFKAAGCADQEYCTNPPAWLRAVSASAHLHHQHRPLRHQHRPLRHLQHHRRAFLHALKLERRCCARSHANQHVVASNLVSRLLDVLTRSTAPTHLHGLKAVSASAEFTQLCGRDISLCYCQVSSLYPLRYESFLLLRTRSE